MRLNEIQMIESCRLNSCDGPKLPKRLKKETEAIKYSIVQSYPPSIVLLLDFEPAIAASFHLVTVECKAGKVNRFAGLRLVSVQKEARAGVSRSEFR